jgi:TonB family protein
MGDWNLLFTRHFGTRYSDSAIELYEQALALLSEHRVFDDSVFSPQTPILLPDFAQDRLMSERSPDSVDYVDIEFEIRKDGRTRRARVVESSGNVPRGAQRDVMDTIKSGRFRPIAENGQLLESAPVTVRYYFD